MKSVADSLFTFDKVKSTLQTTNSTKISGDSIPSILLKNLPEIGFKIIHKLFYNIYIKNNIPSQWSQSKIVEIFKSGDLIPSRFRPICLISNTFKCWQQILYYSHYRSQLIVSPRQHGFTQRRSTSTQIYSVLKIIQELNEEHQELQALALDLSNAFDRLEPSNIYNQLEPHLDPHDLNIIKSIITQQSFHLRRDINQNNFRFGNGTPQGGVFSPIVFSFVMDKIMEIFPDTPDYKIRIYADDLILLAHKKQILVDIAQRVTNHLESNNFTVNATKFQYISNNIINDSIQINNYPPILKSQSIKYLGCYLSADGIDFARDIASKLLKVNLAVSTIKFTKSLLCFRKSFQLFYNGVLLPLYTYNCENYNEAGINQLEFHRIKTIKQLHSNKFNYFQTIYNYMTMQNYQNIKLISLNYQLIELDLPEIPMNLETKKLIKMANQIEMNVKWDTKNPNNRASYFKTDDLIIKIAKSKNPNHIQNLLQSFLTGNLPRKPINNTRTYCTYCRIPVKSLNHLEECDEVFISKSDLLNRLKSNNEELIINTLKLIRDSVRTDRD
eukprot:NODE_711_length_4530_cov_1.118935.p1 type:complete len:556 gc:universal NODE_711_length_4530_cov_1.118935:2661-4328(+)